MAEGHDSQELAIPSKRKGAIAQRIQNMLRGHAGGAIQKTPRSIEQAPEDIPEHWRFAERQAPLKSSQILQLDKGNGYLAFLKSPRDTSDTIDYLFDRNGSPLMGRDLKDVRGTKKEQSHVSSIVVWMRNWGEMDVEYILDNHYARPEPKEPRLHVGFSRQEDLMHPKDKVASSLGTYNVIDFGHNGIIERISLISTRYGNYYGPKLVLSYKQGEFTREILDESSVNIDAINRSSGFRILNQDQPNELVFVRGGKKEYVMRWDKIIEEDRNGNKIPSIVVTESHFDPDDRETRRIVTSPEQIDMEKVKSALLSKPPYSKDENGKLDPPWRNIGQIVGARLSYSYPPPKKPQ